MLVLRIVVMLRRDVLIFLFLAMMEMNVLLIYVFLNLVAIMNPISAKPLMPAILFPVMLYTVVLLP
jgi:hypothetical protein